jgi:hypothetical protein
MENKSKIGYISYNYNLVNLGNNIDYLGIV